MEKNGMVEISAMTLNALKNMLFSEEGVNIDPIVEDLTDGLELNNDLVAINCALLMKGYKPKIDITTRFRMGSTSTKYYIEMKFVSYSLITNKVTVIETEVYHKDGEWKDSSIHRGRVIDYNQWLDYKTFASDYIEEIIEAENSNKK